MSLLPNRNILDGSVVPNTSQYKTAMGQVYDVLAAKVGTDTATVIVASAATINLNAAASDAVDVSGTIPITAVTLAEGATRIARFTNILTFTNGASLILPGGANITTAAGDFAILRGYASGVVRCLAFLRADGSSIGDVNLTGTQTVAGAKTFSSVLTGSAGIVSGASLSMGTGGSAGAGSFYSDANFGTRFQSKSASPAQYEYAFYTSAGTLRAAIDNFGNWTPGADNTYPCGTASLRWSIIYSATGAINTSDATQKTAVAPLTTAEIDASKALAKEIGTYQFLSSVAQKGGAARHHVGMTVQRAIEVMTSFGLDPFRYGFICFDKWDRKAVEHPAIAAVEAVLDDEGNIIEPAIAEVAAWTEVINEAGESYGFRYDELNIFIARGFEARLAALEAAV
ncbi:MAG: hypothetical protein JWQ10_2076 [Herbaspirillum sp.]|nr:hypothetical protein [Herbaspirillum sp.]